MGRYAMPAVSAGLPTSVKLSDSTPIQKLPNASKHAKPTTNLMRYDDKQQQRDHPENDVDCATSSHVGAIAIRQ